MNEIIEDKGIYVWETKYENKQPYTPLDTYLLHFKDGWEEGYKAAVEDRRKHIRSVIDAMPDDEDLMADSKI